MSDARRVETNERTARTRRRRRLPVLAPLAVLLLLLLAGSPAPTPVQRLAGEDPLCLWDPGVPEEAYRIEYFARTHNFSPPPGLKGNSDFSDTNQALPAELAPFLEYDVYPKPPGRGRPPERVVLSPTYPFASWYTPDHYVTFRFMFPPQCLALPTRLFL